jgi:hypothetical protein
MSDYTEILNNIEAKLSQAKPEVIKVDDISDDKELLDLLHQWYQLKQYKEQFEEIDKQLSELLKSKYKEGIYKCKNFEIKLQTVMVERFNKDLLPPEIKNDKRYYNTIKMYRKNIELSL